MTHPVTGGDCFAVNQAQAEHLVTLGWEPAPEPADDGPLEVVVETFNGTRSSLGADLIITGDGTDLFDDSPDPIDLDDDPVGDDDDLGDPAGED